MDARLAKRKLDALKRGIHRVNADQVLPFSVNIVGVGKAGADVVAEVLRTLPVVGPKVSALVIDIGEQDLNGVREAAALCPPDRVAIDIVALPLPSESDLAGTMQGYGAFLELEYPWYRGRPGDAGWLPPSQGVPDPASGLTRAYAKALYGRAYYDGTRAMKAALRRFGAQVDAAAAQPVVCMVFGIGGGTGSGMIVDLARHLTNVVFGRRALTVGVGILPCDGDKPAHRDGAFYACLNELDCLGDEAKNAGVVAACGELFRNPFTAGFLVVPQQHVWEATASLARTHERTDREVAALFTRRDGANLMETLRLLNWVAAPSTQHSAARTPWGPKWIHMLGFADTKGPMAVGPGAAKRLGLMESYAPEYVEMRVAAAGTEADAVARKLETAFAPDVPPQIVEGGTESSVQFILPCLAKTDLEIFYAARDAYDSETPDKRLLDHSLLLDQGVLLNEPSTRLPGMAGAGLNGGDGWIAISLGDLRGGEPTPRRKAKRVKG